MPLATTRRERTAAATAVRQFGDGNRQVDLETAFLLAAWAIKLRDQAAELVIFPVNICNSRKSTPLAPSTMDR
jgi:hypothetical protein